MKKYLLLVILIFSLFVAKAQKITVLDKVSQEPIELVLIYDEQKDRSQAVYTDSKGQADITKLKRSERIFFRHSNYKPREISLKGGLKLSLVFLEPKLKSLAPVEVFARRTSIEEEKIGVTVQVIEGSVARLENPQTAADMLQQSGQVLVQKSQMGGGSPIIRGFEANRILLVVDGVRMNNAIYRSGHLQNAITIDPNILQSTEIIYGPSSVLYGSDALGGVIHFHTKDPKLSREAGAVEIGANVFLRSSTANNEKSGHMDLTLGGEKLGYLFSLSKSSFGDLKMGRVRPHGFSDWGIVGSYIEGAEEGLDIVKPNISKTLQPRTGYDQIDIVNKLIYEFKDSLKIGLNVQFSNSSDINRFDRLNDVSNGLPKFTEWKYGPQKRLLTSFFIDIREQNPLFDNAVITAAYQRIGEDRINRKLNSIERFIREEEVDVQSVNVDLCKRFKKRSTLYYGLEFVNNIVNSKALIKDISNGGSRLGPTRYPDKGSEMQSYAVYLSHSSKWSKTLSGNLGIRYSQTYLNASYESMEFYELPFDEIDLSNGALTGNIGIEKKFSDSFHASFLASTGFKSPNVDDAAKIFEKDGIVVVPNNEIKPEYAANGEISLKKYWNKDQSSFNMTGFYTRIFDAIVRRDFSLNGEEYILYEGELARIQTNMNTNEAEIYGLALGLNWELNNWFRWSSTFNYTVGNDKRDNIPLAHIPPVFGKSELIFSHESISGAFYGYFNGQKSLEKMSPGTTDNPAEATIEGYPSWYTLNLRFSRRFSKEFSVNFAVENLLDHHYKSFASGLSASGRNLIFSAILNL
ncbi:MAG: TonB-dependent receptor [Flavobacteriales bacterium]|nr:TonB-dependent receptor [Flavobacteriales bacterium]